MARILKPTITSAKALKASAAPCLIALAVAEDEALDLSHLPEGFRPAIRSAVKARSWTGSDAARLDVSVTDTSVVSLYGLGPSRSLDLHRMSRWIGAVKADLNSRGDGDLVLGAGTRKVFDTVDSAEWLVAAAALATYKFEDCKEQAPGGLRRVRVLPRVGSEARLKRAKSSGLAVAEGTAFARSLGDTPPNIATPAWMASQARKLAKRRQLKIRVLGPKELKRLSMGAILAVGSGSTNTPRLIRLEVGSRGPIVALVGKGVTFDTGGISLKPGAAMDEMKFDKCGACTVLGVAAAVAALELSVRLHVYVPLAENMPDGKAYRPGDIIKTRSGKTVEVLNTDAEGRLILADALSLACEEKPSALVEFSTLTGATVVALGFHGAAMYSPSDELVAALGKASQLAGERLWRMPLWPEFKEEIKGRHGDIKNLGRRWGGGNSAAAFLAEFVEGCTEWAHLDIAGTAYRGGEQEGDFGATGFGVATMVRWLSTVAKRKS